MNWSIEHLDTCTSTQDEARERARDGAPSGSVVIAKSMQAGRGQHDRSWHAPEGGWYASIVLRDVADPQLLTMALGNAVADIIEIAGATPELKWVNDVWIGGKKVAGILVEAESTGEQLDFLVAGIGINLNGSVGDWPDELRASATTLEAEIGADTCIEDTEEFFLEAIEGWLEKVAQGRTSEILDAFRRRDALRGATVEVDGLRGRANGIDDQGRLLVDDTPIAAGTVTIVA